MNEWLAWVALAAIPAFPLLMTLLNLATWRRAEALGRFEGSVSVLIPARNEARNIEDCVHSVMSSTLPVTEVIVFDDQSSDRTRQIVESLAKTIPGLRLVRGNGVPDGWVGKPHACHRLGQEAKGEVLVFIDADVRLEPKGLARIANALGDADLVSVFPRQKTASFVERCMVPLLSLTYTSWLPLRLVRATENPRFVAANGQILAMRRRDYARIGGFASVAAEIVDDVALTRRAKELGLRTAFIDGDAIATCRMYRSRKEIWDGFSKNLYEGIGESPVALVVVVSLYFFAFVFPYVAVVAGWASGAAGLLGPAMLGVGCNVALRLALAARFHHTLGSVLLHPFAVTGLILIALNSYRWSRRGRVLWGGRAYGRRAERGVS